MAKNIYHDIYFKICDNDITDNIIDARKNTLQLHMLSMSLTFHFVSSLSDINTTAGQNITLPCRAPNYNIIVADWSRADLGSEYVLLYRDGHFDPENQHLSFKGRVDLQDRQMKDGDVSLILRDVTINDTGTYECRVITRGTNRGKRAVLKNNPIRIIHLSVLTPHTCFSPAGQAGGHTGDGGKEDGGHGEDASVGLKLGLPLSAVLAVAAVFLFYLQKL
uniref:Ig-like domain-containing protein n=1 Tax=Oreochromis aureus TaxID=47969 RepID=A0AAZ1XI02_OREAU